MAKKWDVFISHANEDKRTVALPLKEALESKRVAVWIDEQELSAGDSLRERINEGLASSRYGVVILSPSFLSKRWPKDEMHALLAREEGGKKVVIFLRHKISQEEVAQQYPLIADRLSLVLEDRIDRVVDQIMDIIGPAGNAIDSGIAVDFSHDQYEWNALNQSIERHHPGVTRIERGIFEQPDLIDASRVLIVPPPFDTHFAGPEMDRIEKWVDAGGGLFLMGYYDERHHSSNSSELAWRFDFDFRYDLVLPIPDKAKELEPGQQALVDNARSHVFSRDPKYAVRLIVEPEAISHPIVDGVSELAFLSAASIVSTSSEHPEMVLLSPATSWIMRPIGHIQPDGSRPSIDRWEPDRQAAVALLAARTWNKGRVVVSGTWKLWTVDYGDNSRLIGNILSWLSG